MCSTSRRTRWTPSPTSAPRRAGRPRGGRSRAVHGCRPKCGDQYGNDCANFLSQILRNGGWTNVGSMNALQLWDCRTDVNQRWELPS
ncbi:hypothetical protein HGB48_08415 [Actinomadura latina]|uniref:Putative amidase domain-containing protein n=1 Tax=Actinomadura latina TaxID=163603 RepID=A0A846YZ67_9ACTN|nr:hypothetical protein [Actinomadura latina]